MQIFSDYEIGAKLNYHYLNSRPFPHIVLDNFINSNTATQCFNELKTTDPVSYTHLTLPTTSTV